MKPLKSALLSTFLGATLFSHSLTADEVKIAVAANFTDVTRIIARLFEKETGHTTKVSYGSTGKLYSQIEHGAPYELFLAADTARPIKAENEGLAVTGSHFVYAKGKLALWSIDPDAFESGETYLKQANLKHLALANPKTAPYGQAALEVMQNIGSLAELESKLVKGDSISQTFQFVATGNANAGFVALSQIKAWKGEAGSLWEIPQAYYAPIDQAAVMLKKGASNPAATAFLEFLKGKTARGVITEFGYGVE
jgi:molybdate transport system substrate-binding protein